jgi:sugar phosphate isomerase/epimerase
VVSGLVDVPSGRPAQRATPPPGHPALARLSLNQRTTPSWSVAEAVAACVRTGVPAIGLWREPVAETGLATAARLVREAGLRVSSLCRGGFFPAADDAGRRRAAAENRAAVVEAATLDAACLVLVVGGMPPGSRDLDGAREQVADGVAELTPFAAEHGVRLALEPMHPLYCADRGVLSTLGQSLDLAERISSEVLPDVVGVVVDTFHLWWDPEVWTQIARAGSRILSLQVADWITPLPPDALLSRGMPGDGHIDLRRFRAAVDAAGYTGDIEVEIFNAEVWAADADQVLGTVIRRHLDHVA